MKAVWGHARAELIEAEDTIIKCGERKNKSGNGRVGGGGGVFYKHFGISIKF